MALTSWLSLDHFDAGIAIDGFLSAILGAVVIGIATGVIGFFLLRD